MERLATHQFPVHSHRLSSHPAQYMVGPEQCALPLPTQTLPKCLAFPLLSPACPQFEQQCGQGACEDPATCSCTHPFPCWPLLHPAPCLPACSSEQQGGQGAREDPAVREGAGAIQVGSTCLPAYPFACLSACLPPVLCLLCCACFALLCCKELVLFRWAGAEGDHACLDCLQPRPHLSLPASRCPPMCPLPHFFFLLLFY